MSDQVTCREDGCPGETVHERRGDEEVFMCTEHGWVATIHESGSGDGSPGFSFAKEVGGSDRTT